MIQVRPADVPGTGTILVVDDNEANRRLLIDLLTVHGYAVRSAHDGASCLAAVAESSPDLILLCVCGATAGPVRILNPGGKPPGFFISFLLCSLSRSLLRTYGRMTTPNRSISVHD